MKDISYIQKDIILKEKKLQAYYKLSLRRFRYIWLILGSLIGCFLIIGVANSSENGFYLDVSGNASSGYGVNIVYDSQTVARHNQGGEFSITFQNSDRSLDTTINDWKAKSYRQEKDSLLLSGNLDIPRCGAKFDVSVKYTILQKDIIRKEINLYQKIGPKLRYILENRLESVEKPESFWSFENGNSPGDAVYEVYPAAGFRVHGMAIGLLTDNGYRNQWTRINRHRDAGLSYLEGLKRLPDAELVKLADETERKNSQNYVSFKFGEVKDFLKGEFMPLPLLSNDKWTTYENMTVRQERENSFITGQGLERSLGGMLVPLHIKKNTQYTVKFLYKSNAPLATRLWNLDKSKDYGVYKDDVPSSPDEWRTFQHSFFSSSMANPEEDVIFHIGKGYYYKGDVQIQVKELQVIENTPMIEAYNPVSFESPIKKTLFIFAEAGKTHRDVMLACQTKLAEGLGFQGTIPEKIFFATTQMLTWVLEPDDLRPTVVPSTNYQPDMYMRDSFWTVAAMNDKEIAEKIWNQWASTQDSTGCVATLFTPYIMPSTNIDNDSNMHFIIWAYVNKMRYNSPIDKQVIQRAIDYLRNQFDSKREGKHMSRTAGRWDCIWQNKPMLFANNQGEYVSVLKCAKKLGADVTDKEVQNATEAYQSLYNPKLGYIVFADQMPDLLSPDVLMGEFLSLWLWNKPILSDEAVIKTLDKLPVIAGKYPTVPCIIRSNGKFISKEDNIFSGNQYWEPGVYANGASWLLYEYLAYVAGLKHGWKPAKERMAKRLEFEFSPELEPVSHEFCPVTGKKEDWWPSSRVFGWNCFVIIANQVANSEKSGI